MNASATTVTLATRSLQDRVQDYYTDASHLHYLCDLTSFSSTCTRSLRSTTNGAAAEQRARTRL